MSTVIGKIDIEAFDGNGLVFEGTDGAERLKGTGLDDLLIGKDGDDTLRGENGDDQIIGGLGDDLILGGFGNDIIEAGAGDDEIYGQWNDDYINGAEGDDTIYGGKGADTIVGGKGSDELYGGGGPDVFEFNFFRDFAEDEFGEIDVDEIKDFHVGQDSIVLNGISDSAVVTFDAESNSILVDGETIINLTPAHDNLRAPEINKTDDGGYEIV